MGHVQTPLASVAFYRTRPEEHLRNVGASTLVFAGCNSPNCPRTSIYEASESDFRIVLVEDAVSGLYDHGQLEMRNIGVTLINTAELLVRLSKTKTPTAM
jgi:nicotinamidase-related amidase